MKNFVLSVCSVSILFSGHAFAAACYTPREAEAEQGIRIHSELMVIGLNCTHMSTKDGKNLYNEHRKFTVAHAKLLSTYEDIMMNYLKRTGSSNPEKDLHEIRTNFANKISKDAAVMRPDKFCRTYSSRIEFVSKLDEQAFRKWAATPYPGFPVSKPRCSQ